MSVPFSLGCMYTVISNLFLYCSRCFSCHESSSSQLTNDANLPLVDEESVADESAPLAVDDDDDGTATDDDDTAADDERAGDPGGSPMLERKPTVLSVDSERECCGVKTGADISDVLCCGAGGGNAVVVVVAAAAAAPTTDEGEVGPAESTAGDEGA